ISVRARPSIDVPLPESFRSRMCLATNSALGVKGTRTSCVVAKVSKPISPLPFRCNAKRVANSTTFAQDKAAFDDLSVEFEPSLSSRRRLIQLHSFHMAQADLCFSELLVIVFA